MKKKQVIGIILVCAILLATGYAGTRAAIMLNKSREESAKAAVRNLDQVLADSQKQISLPQEDFIGQINITGTIQAQDSSISTTAANEYQHDYYLDYIEKMEQADNNKGIFLFVNSPGGTVYESDEMYLRLMEYKKKTGRPVYAYFGSEACSGAYYISMAADKIYSNRNSWTGSIGVIISLMNYEKLLDKIGVSEIDITTGDNKTIGSGTQKMTKEQKQILQALVDEAYEQFTQIVSEGRHMNIKKVKQLADGRIYSAQQAKENGLIDEIMGLEEAKAAITAELGADQITYYVPPKNSRWMDYFNQILGLAGEFGSKSEIQAARELIESDESGVLMYYAQ